MTSLKTLLIPLVLCGLITTTACNNNNPGTTSTTDTTAGNMKEAKGSMEEAANQATTAAKETMVHNPDSTFVAEVAIANSEEINMLQAGIDKGSDKDLKSDAKMMIADHKGLKKKLEAYAAKKNYPIAADDEGKASQELHDMDSKGSKDWDKAWASFMYDAHEKTIGKFDGAQNNVKDDELKTMITNTLPTLHSHLDMMNKLVGKLK